VSSDSRQRQQGLLALSVLKLEWILQAGIDSNLDSTRLESGTLEVGDSWNLDSLG